MPKFIGNICFVQDNVETSPSVYDTVVTVKKYRGDVLRSTYSNARSDTLNNDFQVNATISIVADNKLKQNVGSIIWVEYLGVKWKVTSVDFTEPPRLKLVLGGVYKEEDDEDETTD